MKKNLVRNIAICSILMALGAVLKYYGIMITTNLRISFFAIPLILGGLVGGIPLGLLTALGADLLYSIISGYAFNIGYTISALYYGVLGGLFLLYFNKKQKLPIYIILLGVFAVLVLETHTNLLVTYIIYGSFTAFSEMLVKYLLLIIKLPLISFMVKLIFERVILKLQIIQNELKKEEKNSIIYNDRNEVTKMSKKNLVMLAILDGYGINTNTQGNAVAAAKKPNLDYLFSKYPYTTIGASGEDVGLPAGQMGNSEVGHMNIGAGRIVYQSLTRVNIAVREDTLASMPAIKEAFNHALKNNSSLHIMGLLSDGGVHSHIDHILYLMEKAYNAGIKNVYVHSFLDGRDVPPKSAKEFLSVLNNACHDGIKPGVVSGRYYAMDRDKIYERVQLAYDALVKGSCPVKDILEGIDESYANDVTDEFVVPYICNSDATIKENDSVIFANFRPDRAIQISLALTNPTITPIENPVEFKNLCFVSMMLYSEDVKGLVNFGLQTLDNLYGNVISDNGLTQLRIAETQKYAHVTYFFDGGEDVEIKGSDRILIDSPKIETFDTMPEMSAYQITDRVLEEIAKEKYDTIILNYANCDMVGHTAVMDATVKAVEVVDECVGKLYEAVKKVGGTLVITADHGNADMLVNETGNPHTAHTTNPVPFCITKEGLELEETGNLGDIAPTMLDLLGIEKPAAMTGKSMIKK